MKVNFNKIYKIIIVFIILETHPILSEASSIDELSSLSENQIDIAIVNLTLAKEIFPETNIQYYSGMVDAMIKDVLSLTKGSKNPDYRVRVLNTYIHKVLRMSYDYSDPHGKKPENRYISGILSTMKGSCANFPMVYLAIAQRLGYPIYPVDVPNHILLRYDDPRMKGKNIETTSGGYASDEEYISDLNIPKVAIEKGTYLKKLTYREYLGLMIEDNAIYWANNKQVDRAIEYLNISISLNPRLASSYHSLGLLYRQEARFLARSYLFKHKVNEMIVKSNFYFDKAFGLGFVHNDDKEYLIRLKKSQAKHEKLLSKEKKQ